MQVIAIGMVVPVIIIDDVDVSGLLVLIQLIALGFVVVWDMKDFERYKRERDMELEALKQQLEGYEKGNDK